MKINKKSICFISLVISILIFSSLVFILNCISKKYFKEYSNNILNSVNLIKNIDLDKVKVKIRGEEISILEKRVENSNIFILLVDNNIDLAKISKEDKIEMYNYEKKIFIGFYPSKNFIVKEEDFTSFIEGLNKEKNNEKNENKNEENIILILYSKLEKNDGKIRVIMSNKKVKLIDISN